MRNKQTYHLINGNIPNFALQARIVSAIQIFANTGKLVRTQWEISWQAKLKLYYRQISYLHIKNNR